MRDFTDLSKRNHLCCHDRILKERERLTIPVCLGLTQVYNGKFPVPGELSVWGLLRALCERPACAPGRVNWCSRSRLRFTVRSSEPAFHGSCCRPCYRGAWRMGPWNKTRSCQCYLSLFTVTPVHAFLFSPLKPVCVGFLFTTDTFRWVQASASRCQPPKASRRLPGPEQALEPRLLSEGQDAPWPDMRQHLHPAASDRPVNSDLNKRSPLPPFMFIFSCGKKSGIWDSQTVLGEPHAIIEGSGPSVYLLRHPARAGLVLMVTRRLPLLQVS